MDTTVGALASTLTLAGEPNAGETLPAASFAQVVQGGGYAGIYFQYKSIVAVDDDRVVLAVYP